MHLQRSGVFAPPPHPLAFLEARMNGHISTRTRELKPSSTHPHARKSARTHAHTYTCTQKISSYPRDRNRTPAVAHKQQRYTIRHTQRKHRDGPRKIKAMRMEQTHLSDPVPRIGFKAIRMEQTSISDPVPRTGWRVFLKRLLDWGHSSRPPPLPPLATTPPYNT